jgi:hypothetical protein
MEGPPVAAETPTMPSLTLMEAPASDTVVVNFVPFTIATM